MKFTFKVMAAYRFNSIEYYLSYFIDEIRAHFSDITDIKALFNYFYLLLRVRVNLINCHSYLDIL